MPELTDTQRNLLAAVCDTVVPAVPIVPDRDGFFGRKASDLWVPRSSPTRNASRFGSVGGRCSQPTRWEPAVWAPIRAPASPTCRHRVNSTT